MNLFVTHLCCLPFLQSSRFIVCVCVCVWETWFVCWRYISHILKIVAATDLSSRYSSALHKTPKPFKTLLSCKSFKGRDESSCVRVWKGGQGLTENLGLYETRGTSITLTNLIFTLLLLGLLRSLCLNTSAHTHTNTLIWGFKVVLHRLMLMCGWMLATTKL